MPLRVTGERYAYCKNLISLNFVLRQAQHKIKGLGLNRALTSGERPYMSSSFVQFFFSSFCGLRVVQKIGHRRENYHRTNEK